MNNSTFFKNPSYFYLLDMAESLMILVNVYLSKDHNILDVFVFIEACLGTLYNKDNYPNDSPATYVLRYVCLSPFLNYL